MIQSTNRGTKRFDVSAIYPKCKKKGSYTQVPYCKVATSYEEQRLGPGTYDVTQGDFTPCVLMRKASGPGWKRAQETERLTQMPHLLYKEMWEKNRFMKQNMGPGRYNIKDFLELCQMRPCSRRGICETREERFKESKQVVTPGPGTYGKGGNPYVLIEEKASHCCSARGMMDSETIRCQTLPGMGSDLGPGTYNLRSSTDDTLNRVVSKRGPYDTFTGDRAKMISGYFATPKRNEVEPGAYKVKTFVDELRSAEKKKHGVFGTIPQYAEVPKERIYHCTLAQCQHLPNPVGVGRYDITKEVHGKTETCHRSSFLSKKERYLANAERDKQLQERIQPTNISATKRQLPVIDATVSNTTEQNDFCGKPTACNL